MQSAAFQLNKVRRLIQTQGQTLQCKKPRKNEFGEPSGELYTIEIKVVYHETFGFASGYVTKTTSEATTIRRKALPMVFTLWEDIGDLHHQDMVTFNGVPYRINEIKNIAEASLVADISLEEVQT